MNERLRRTDGASAEERRTTKERGSDYLSFFYLANVCASASFSPGEFFLDGRSSPSVHPSILPIEKRLDGRTNGRARTCSAARRRVE